MGLVLRIDTRNFCPCEQINKGVVWSEIFGQMYKLGGGCKARSMYVDAKIVGPVDFTMSQRKKVVSPHLFQW